MNLRVVPAVLLLSAILSGCLEAELGLDHLEADVGGVDAPKLFESTGCRESGSIAVYAMPADPELAEGFERADIRDDVGDPIFGAYQRPLPPGPKWGNWHIAVVCNQYTLDGTPVGALKWGWIGVKVKPPAWDESGIERQFFVADLSFSDDRLWEGVRAQTSAHTAKTLDASIAWIDARAGLLHFLLDDANHGLYEAYFAMEPYRPLAETVTRFWIAGHVDLETGAGYRPYALDFVTVPDSGATYYVHRDGASFFRHDDPGQDELGGRTLTHYGPSGGGLLWDSFARTMVWGDAPDVLLSEIYAH